MIVDQDGRSCTQSNDLEAQEFHRLKNAMDAVGFSSDVQSRLIVNDDCL